MPSRKRNSYADYLKGILIFTVLAAHTGALTRLGGIPHETTLPALYVMGAWHMPLFMAVAGWFFRCSVERRSLGTLVWNKVQTLVIPTAFWWLVCAVTVWLLARCSLPTDSLSGGCPWFMPSVVSCIALGTLCH